MIRVYAGEVVEIATKNPTQGFIISLDGNLFGPFRKVRLLPSKAGGGKPLALPVRTFFPFDL